MHSNKRLNTEIKLNYLAEKSQAIYSILAQGCRKIRDAEMKYGMNNVALKSAVFMNDQNMGETQSPISL